MDWEKTTLEHRWLLPSKPTTLKMKTYSKLDLHRKIPDANCYQRKLKSFVKSKELSRTIHHWLWIDDLIFGSFWNGWTWNLSVPYVLMGSRFPMVSYCLSLLSAPAQSVMVGSTIAIHNSAWMLGPTTRHRGLWCDFGKKKRCRTKPQTIHVWCIYLHFP